MHNSYNARAGTVDITPSEPLPLAGFQDRRGRYTRVHDRLELNALVIEGSEGTIAILSADLLFVTDTLKQRLLQLVPKSLRLDHSRLLVAASHTHFAPGIDVTKPRLGIVENAYVDQVLTMAARLITSLSRPGEGGASIDVSEGFASHAINRRRRGWVVQGGRLPYRGVLRAPNPNGSRDESVRVLIVRDGLERPIAIVWSYACHPSAFPLRDQVSSEFPGMVREKLRRRFGNRLPIIFLQGFAGDIRPRATGSPRTVRQRAKSLISGPLFFPLSIAEYEAWAASLAERVVAIAEGPTAKQSFALGAHIREHPLAALCRHAAPEARLTFQTLRLTRHLRLACMSAEVVSAYGRKIAALFEEHVIPIAYSDWVFGYLPTSDMLTEGGYEVEGFASAFDFHSVIRDDVEDVVMSVWRDIASSNDE